MGLKVSVINLALGHNGLLLGIPPFVRHFFFCKFRLYKYSISTSKGRTVRLVLHSRGETVQYYLILHICL